MIESVTLAASSALQAQSLPAWINQVPSAQDLATFDSSMSEVQVLDNTAVSHSTGTERTVADPPMVVMTHHDYSNGYYPETHTQATSSVSNQIIEHFAAIDAKYQGLFNNQQSLSVIGSVGQSPPEAASTNAYTDAGIASLMQNFQQSVALQTEISVWSAQVNLLTSGISKSTQGIQTLFRNSG